MPTLVLGNAGVAVAAAGAEATLNGAAPSITARHDLGQQITTLALPAGASLDDVLAAWKAHSVVDPAWVEGDNDGFVAAVAEHFGCPVGCPVSYDEWKEG